MDVMLDPAIPFIRPKLFWLKKSSLNANMVNRISPYYTQLACIQKLLCKPKPYSHTLLAGCLNKENEWTAEVYIFRGSFIKLLYAISTTYTHTLQMNGRKTKS